MLLIKNKLNRFFQSRKILKIKYYFHKIFKEKNIGSLDFKFDDKPHRSEVIQKIIDHKKFNTYCEIGCFSNELFNKIEIKNKVGIDPVSGGTVKTTSDLFFKDNKLNFDIVFIDGLHHYEQVKKDINNSLRFLNLGGIILLHDCLPSNVFDQAVPRCTYNWNGDVWKAFVEIRCKEDLDSYTLYADQGIGIIFKRTNKNLLNLKIDNFSKLKFSDYFYNYKIYMNIISTENLFKILDDKEI